MLSHRGDITMWCHHFVSLDLFFFSLFCSFYFKLYPSFTASFLFVWFGLFSFSVLFGLDKISQSPG